MVLLPAAAPRLGLEQFSLSEVVKELEHPLGTKVLTSPKTGKLNGASVVMVTQQDGGELDVAASGPPYPVHLVTKGSSSGSITFNDIGGKQNITAPPSPLNLPNKTG